MQLTVLPLLAERMEGKFDVFEVLLETLEKNNTKLQEGDVLVISTKYISNSQGRIIELQRIRPSDEGSIPAQATATPDVPILAGINLLSTRITPT